jgi:hypothetical protein
VFSGKFLTRIGETNCFPGRKTLGKRFGRRILIYNYLIFLILIIIAGQANIAAPVPGDKTCQRFFPDKKNSTANPQPGIG